MRANHIMGPFEAPSKNPKKCHIMWFVPGQKNDIIHFKNQRYISIFMSHTYTHAGDYISKLPGSNQKFYHSWASVSKKRTH
jgi:hypothetical protein